MKKLMIVAAAAAMIGSASAYDVVYQATYNLKTTVGKSGSSTQTINLGKSGSTFWYQDESITNKFAFNVEGYVTNIVDTTNFVFKTVKGTKVPTLTKAGLANDALLLDLYNLSFIYDEKSAGAYCLTFKYKFEFCYRVAGTIKATGYFIEDECLKQYSTVEIVDAFGSMWVSPTKPPAKAEFYDATIVADAGNYEPAALLKKDKDADNAYGWLENIDIIDNTKDDRVITELSLAGHGTYGKIAGSSYGVTGVSGYAVGTADMPDCVSCCAPAVASLAYDCCGIGATDTAVFGTFSFKYVSNETKKLH